MSHTNPTPRRTWPWVVLVVVVVVAIIVGASVISTLVAGAPAAIHTTPPALAPSATPTVTPTTIGTSKPHSSGLSAKKIAEIEGAIEDADATELYDELSTTVHVQFAASDFDADRSRDNAVIDLDYVNEATNWKWNLDAATLARFRAGAYRDSFPTGAIVGESAEGYVISFTITKAEITAIFVSKSVDLVTAPKP